MTARTLSGWIDRLLNGPTTIECPRMEVLGRDHEPSVFTGPGQIVVGEDTHMHFVMHATPRDGSDAFRQIVQAKNNPYNHRDQFRMRAVGYDGTEYSGGYTALQIGGESRNVWQLSGAIQSLHIEAKGFGVAETKGVELVYDRPLRLPIPMNMVKTVHRGDKEVLWSRSAGTQTVEVLDASIEFFQSADHKHIWAVAEATEMFPHPHLENWISEPLNLLLGEVVTPRLQARNFGDCRAFIALHPSSGRAATTIAATILREDPHAAHERFWGFYRDILTFVATAADGRGHRNFEAHPLTRYYWEIIQATKGSNWVLCMTLASTVEGIVKLMFSEAERKSDWDESNLGDLIKVITDWSGDRNLRGNVLNYLANFKTKGVANTLKSLRKEGVLTVDQVNAWTKLRNSSMHGEMVMPWSDQEQDSRIESLIGLTHCLSEAYIRRELGKRPTPLGAS
jgi:hypothetical protein